MTSQPLSQPAVSPITALLVAARVRDAAYQLALSHSAGTDQASAIASAIQQLDLSELLSTLPGAPLDSSPNEPPLAGAPPEPEINAPVGYGEAFRCTDSQFWAMCSAGMSRPVSLGKADLTRSYVYARDYGVFYVDPGRHQITMALLLAWKHGLNNGIDVSDRLGLGYSAEAAEHYLQTTPGTCFKSSVSTTAETWSIDHLTPLERRAFGRLRSLA